MKLKVRRGERILGEYDMQGLVIALQNGDISAYDEIFYPQDKRWIAMEAIRDIRENLNTNFDWKLRVAGVDMGPMSKREVMSRIKEGKLKEDDLAYHPKTGEWVIVGQVREFEYAIRQAMKSRAAPREAGSPLVKTCEKCGAQNLVKNRVCMNCGARFPMEEGMRDEGEETPVVERLRTGAIAGALGGLGCSIPVLMLTFLGLGFISLFLPIGGARAAGILLVRLLMFVIAGAAVGTAMGYLAAFEFPKGSGIGAIVGSLIGLVLAIFAGAGYLRSTVEWGFDCMLMGLLIVYVGKQFFDAQKMVAPEKLRSKEETPKQRAISIAVGVAVGLLIAVFVIRGQVMSNRPSARRARAVKAIKVQVTDGFYNSEEGAFHQVFVVEGNLTNVSKRAKYMIGLEGYLMDADGDTIDTEFDTFSRIEVGIDDILKGNIFEKSEEIARAGVLQPREGSDFKMVFNLYGEMPDVKDYDVVVTSVLDYKGKP
jgi:hypothetical protein